ncbi:hypothetical protein GCM10018951_27010 [Pseudarthrobacter polychromogenes]
MAVKAMVARTTIAAYGKRAGAGAEIAEDMGEGSIQGGGVERGSLAGRIPPLNLQDPAPCSVPFPARPRCRFRRVGPAPWESAGCRFPDLRGGGQPCVQQTGRDGGSEPRRQRKARHY